MCTILNNDQQSELDGRVDRSGFSVQRGSQEMWERGECHSREYWIMCTILNNDQQSELDGRIDRSGFSVQRGSLEMWERGVILGNVGLCARF